VSDGIVVSGGTVEEIGNRFEGGGCSGSLSSYEVPILKPPLRGSGGHDEPSVGEPVGQLLMGITLGKVELLELISEALQIDRGRHRA
jgi:hypothetical protein